MKQFVRLLVASTFLLFSFTFAQTQGVHLSWNDKDETSTKMAITWWGSKLNEGMVMYGTDDRLSHSQKAISHFSYKGKVNIYKATLTQLKPNTIYYYKCGSAEEGWSNVYRFRTAPATGSQDKFVVGVWGDTQDNEFNTHFEQTDTIVQQLQRYPIQFTIHMGDIVNAGPVAAKWEGFFRCAQPVNAIAPFMHVPGNHDVSNNAADSGFQKPFPVYYEFINLPGRAINYSFNYGNTHFVAVNSGQSEKDAAVATNFAYAKRSLEYRWLEDDLSKARKDKNIKWIILYLHHPLYSFGWSQVDGWHERLAPLLDKYKVDLCLAGHRHVYERHTAIRNDQVLPQKDDHIYQHPAGTVYITNGSAGGQPTGTGGSDMPSMVYTSKVKMYNFAIMMIEGNSIRYDVYDNHGVKIDYFKLIK
ncbi:MAG: metallophosphoesterase family protein [Bacteroidota bacterium]|nr:metallophosphoesterase family protein [Bacteroidota bacterium]